MLNPPLVRKFGEGTRTSMLGSLAARIHEPLSRTEWQRRHFEQVSDSARLASERALPELLAALNGHTFRDRLVKRRVDT